MNCFASRCTVIKYLLVMATAIWAAPLYAEGTTEHQGNGHTRMMLLGQDAEGNMMVAARYRVKPKEFQDYFFVRGSGAIPTELRMDNKTGEAIKVFFYNPNDKVRGVALFSKKIAKNGHVMAPIGAYYIVAKQDKAFGKKISEGGINHERVFVFTPHNGGVKKFKPYEPNVTFDNQSGKDLRFLIYNAKDKVRAVAKKNLTVDSGKETPWEKADPDFQYKVFEQRFLDKLVIEGKSEGKQTLLAYSAPTRGYSRLKAFDHFEFADLPQVRRGIGTTSDISSQKYMFGRLKTDHLALIAYVSDFNSPLRRLGPVKTQWRPTSKEMGDWISPFTLPFDQTPSVVEVTVRDFERAAGDSGADILAEVAFGTTPGGKMQWGYIRAEDNAVGVSRWRTVAEVKWVNAKSNLQNTGYKYGMTATPFPGREIDATVLAVRDDGALHISDFQVQPGTGTGFELEGDGGKLVRWESHLETNFVGRPAALYTGPYDLHMVARTKDGKLMYAKRPGAFKNDKYRRDNVSKWKEIASGAAGDPQTYHGGKQLYVAYRRTDGRHALLQYDIEKNQVVRNDVNHGNKFVNGPILMVTADN